VIIDRLVFYNYGGNSKEYDNYSVIVCGNEKLSNTSNKIVLFTNYKAFQTV